MLLKLRRSRSSTLDQQALAARLPPEITQLILLETQRSGGRQDLARALRVCRSWNAFVGMLYRCVHLDLTALIRFHHSVGGRLAALVKELYLPPLYCLPRWYWSFPNSPFLNSNNRRHECRGQFALAVDVVRRCASLHTLHFPSHGPFARLKSLPSGHLRNLKSLMLNSYDVAYFSSVLPPSLSLDNLAELRMLNYHFLPSAPWQGLARMPRLRILRIWSCSLDWDSLGALVTSVSGTLRFVELRLTSWPTSNVPAMFRALASVERSLTMLAIRGSCGAKPDALAAHLARFVALRSLHYDELFCARAVATPPALRRLALVTRMRTEVWDYVRRLADWLRDAPPGLEELSIEVHSPRRRDVRVWKWLAFCLDARCARHGIRLHVLVVRDHRSSSPCVVTGVPFSGQTKCFYAVNRPTPERVIYETVDRIGRKGHQLKSSLKSMLGIASAPAHAQG